MGIELIATAAANVRYSNQIYPNRFYRTYPGETFIHIGIAFQVLWLWNVIARKISRYSIPGIIKLLQQKHYTDNMIQWIPICWLLPAAGYQTMNTLQTLIMSIYITITTAIIHHVTKMSAKLITNRLQ